MSTASARQAAERADPAQATPASSTALASTSDAEWEAAPTDKRERWQRIGQRTLPTLSVVIFLLIWQWVGSGINPILLATPSKVAEAFRDLAARGLLWPAFVTSMRDLSIGYALAIAVGVLLGIVMGRSPVFERIMNPYVNFFQATPLIALVPLVVIWFGIGVEANIVVTFMLAVWSIIINTTTGVQTTPGTLIDVTRVYKFNRWQVITKVALPNAVPSMFAGFRIGLGKALIGMIIAEMEISVNGLGGMVITYGNEFRTADLLAAVITSSAVGVVIAALLEVIRRVAFPWTKES